MTENSYFHEFVGYMFAIPIVALLLYVSVLFILVVITTAPVLVALALPVLIFYHLVVGSISIFLRFSEWVRSEDGTSTGSKPETRASQLRKQRRFNWVKSLPILLLELFFLGSVAVLPYAIWLDTPIQADAIILFCSVIIFVQSYLLYRPKRTRVREKFRSRRSEFI